MVDTYLGCISWTHPKSTFIFHGQQVPIVGNQVQDVLVDVDERAQHAQLLQPLLTQHAPPRHKQYVEVSWQMHLVLTERCIMQEIGVKWTKGSQNTWLHYTVTVLQGICKPHLNTFSAMMSMSSSRGRTKKMIFLTSAEGSLPLLRVNIFSTSCSLKTVINTCLMLINKKPEFYQIWYIAVPLTPDTSSRWGCNLTIIFIVDYTVDYFPDQSIS